MKVIFKGKEYITSIRVENNFNRSKLILGRELRNEVVRYIDVSWCNGNYEKILLKLFLLKKMIRDTYLA